MKKANGFLLGVFLFLIILTNILLFTTESTNALPAQNFKLSYGAGSCPGSSGGDYWGSCHLPGSECSIMPCTNFNW